MRANKSSASRKEIEGHVRHYVNAEKKAHFIVERLALEDVVNETEIRDIINAITPEHYADIVEERSISKQCGYILCKNKLEKVPKKQYHISAKSNKVYDISERKLFCSSFCFTASKWLQQQVPETPLLSRNKVVEVDVLQKSDEADQTCCTSCTEDTVIGSTDPTADDLQPSVDNMVGRDVLDKSSVKGGVSHQETKECVQAVKDTLTEWFTEQTMELIKLKQSSTDRNDDDEDERYEVNNGNPNSLKLLPSNLESPKTEAPDPMEKLPSAFDSKLTISERRQDVLSEVILPPLDHKGQQIIRRKIVGERLRRSFNRILPSFGLQLNDVVTDLMQVLRSFSFSSRNILLSLIEWRLMTMILLQLIATFTPVLRKAMNENQEVHNGLLMALNTDINAIEEVVQSLISKCDESGSSREESNYEELD